MNKPEITLCIPTNGVIEWVFPVLDSIYNQKIDEDVFEVVITDNGENNQFNKLMLDYASKHRNIVYEKTNAVGFLNQIECFKLAKGEFVKFVNHRSLLLDGSIKRLLDFKRNNFEKKPTVFFMNGVLPELKEIERYSSFDAFVRGLSYYSSWSAGIAFWKDKVMPILLAKKEYESTFPHMEVLFAIKDDKEYVIDNKVLFSDIDADHSKKGKYNLFEAFAIHYIECIQELQTKSYITYETYNYVKEKNQKFIEGLYADFVLLKLPCSYDLSNAKESISKYYNFSEIEKRARIKAIKRRIIQIIKKIIKR